MLFIARQITRSGAVLYVVGNVVKRIFKVGRQKIDRADDHQEDQPRDQGVLHGRRAGFLAFQVAEKFQHSKGLRH